MRLIVLILLSHSQLRRSSPIPLWSHNLCPEVDSSVDAGVSSPVPQPVDPTRKIPIIVLDDDEEPIAHSSGERKRRSSGSPLAQYQLSLDQLPVSKELNSVIRVEAARMKKQTATGMKFGLTRDQEDVQIQFHMKNVNMSHGRSFRSDSRASSGSASREHGRDVVADKREESPVSIVPSSLVKEEMMYLANRFALS